MDRKHNAKLTENAKSKQISKEKLKSEYYIIPYEQILVDYDYFLSVKKTKIIKVQRKVQPVFNNLTTTLSNLNYNLSKVFKPNLARECGDALLVCLSYLEVCKDRIFKKEQENEK